MGDTTVLVIDDHREVCDLLARRLNSLDGFRVVAQTSNPITAAELAHLLRPQIIVADFKRRGTYGAQMYEWIKRSSPDSQLVVLTSYLANGDEEMYLGAGAAVCLLKETRLRDLDRELRKLVQVPEAEEVQR